MTDLKSEYHRRIGERAEQQKRKAEHERQEATEYSNIEAIVRSIEGVSEKLDRQADHNTPEKKSERGWHKAEVIGLWAAAAVGITAIWIASSDSEHQRVEMHGQLTAMQGQLAVMENDKRPWLNANISIDKYVEITEWGGSRGISVPLKIAMKNYGQVPAVNIRINARVWPHPGNPKRAEILPFQKQVCDQGIETADKDPIGGIAIFPSEATTADTNPTIGGEGVYKNGTPVLWAVFGCVDYTYGDRKHGQTGFNYLLGKNIDGQVFGVPFAEGIPLTSPPSEEQIKAGFPKEVVKGAKIPIGDIWFMAADSGNYAK